MTHRKRSPTGWRMWIQGERCRFSTCRADPGDNPRQALASGALQLGRRLQLPAGEVPERSSMAEAHGGEMGSLMGPAAQRGWKSFVSSCEDNLAPVGAGYRREWLRVLSCVWPLSWLTSKFGAAAETKPWLPDNSIMSWYLAIETGFFRFPAQVFNRENGHVGFMLSCYDAELSYDSRTDTFTEGVPWERLRAPPVESSAHDLHVSDCLADLRPGTMLRSSGEGTRSWWYGVVGHLGSCGGNELHCRCHRSDAVALEFNQYTEGSRWRRAILSRKDHREEGNEAEGFYGGVRKLRRDDEIAAWRRLWPTGVLD
ncbi:unnamed protein product [Spirodela intermedia]|uniref:Uncharacterized protein n=1 Tax=Spirodela intermedia TaxID=51605 RepID=A0A7I8I9P0_SPIIN|nr:unnamed protein product [Spirodela intermedia]CAA6654426.1 unnamed protein product [Spirodela intermedia]